MTAHQNKSNRKYQDSLFRFLFGTHRNREFTLSLYNTLNHTDYTNADDIEFVTLNDDMFFVNMKDDVGFIIYDQLKSGWNENIPLQFLLFCTDELRRRNPKIRLPFIRCVLLYGGDKKVDDGTVLCLSDNMNSDVNGSDVEVKVRVYNIGRNIDLLNQCQPVKEYSLIITDIKDLMAEGLDREDAIRTALSKVDSSYVLYPIVCSEYDEVRDMLNREYTLEEALNDRLEEGLIAGRSEGRAQGRAEGLAEGIAVKTTEFIVAMLKKKMSLRDIIELSNASEETIRDVAHQHGLNISE